MDKGGQTVSATEFAELTGVSRERLRTWERRFDFPRPARIARGPRRYALADAARVVAVRRAAEQGVPLPRAIAEATDATASELSEAALAAVAAVAPIPVVVVSGPEPLRVVWVNGSLQAVDGAIAPGARLDALSWFMGSDLERTLRTLFAGDTAVLECAHPAWVGGGTVERSIAYRLPTRGGEPPAVALVGVDRDEERRARRELGELQQELTRVRVREQRRQRWLALAASLAERFQRDAGEALLGATVDTLVRRLGAVDAGVALYVAGQLALGTTSRSLLGPHMVTVTRYDDLAALMQRSTPEWLAPATAGAFGVHAGLHCLAVPLGVVGERLGALLIVFDEPADLDEDIRNVLTVVAAGLGFVVLRDRLVASTRGGGEPEAPS
ncbi:MAG TPA: MerR family transcriptional regulator [Conexibacter sp.]|nr:MerR family transcriptional regulator [Conexibacter sp.]